MKNRISCLRHLLKEASLPERPSGFSFDQTSVSFLLFDKDELHLLAILKADNKGYPWRNQVALPGGHVDDEDKSNLDAARREMEEEVNISRNNVNFIGSMGHFQTLNNKDIEVFIGMWNGEGNIRFEKAEISKVLEIPLKRLIKIHMESNFHNRHPDVMELVYPFEDVVIWGVTAKMVHFFIELLYPYIENKDE
jgi:coenzyme A diphosphatase NUDT7